MQDRPDPHDQIQAPFVSILAFLAHVHPSPILVPFLYGSAGACSLSPHFTQGKYGPGVQGCYNRREPEPSLGLLTVPSSLWPQGGAPGPFRPSEGREGAVAGPTGASPLLLWAASTSSHCPLGFCPGPYFPHPSSQLAFPSYIGLMAQCLLSISFHPHFPMPLLPGLGRGRPGNSPGMLSTIVPSADCCRLDLQVVFIYLHLGHTGKSSELEQQLQHTVPAMSQGSWGHQAGA